VSKQTQVVQWLSIKLFSILALIAGDAFNLCCNKTTMLLWLHSKGQCSDRQRMVRAGQPQLHH
jgi:hypothetical protein